MPARDVWGLDPESALSVLWRGRPSGAPPGTRPVPCTGEEWRRVGTALVRRKPSGVRGLATRLVWRAPDTAALLALLTRLGRTARGEEWETEIWPLLLDADPAGALELVPGLLGIVRCPRHLAWLLQHPAATPAVVASALAQGRAGGSAWTLFWEQGRAPHLALARALDGLCELLTRTGGPAGTDPLARRVADWGRVLSREADTGATAWARLGPLLAPADVPALVAPALSRSHGPDDAQQAGRRLIEGLHRHPVLRTALLSYGLHGGVKPTVPAGSRLALASQLAEWEDLDGAEVETALRVRGHPGDDREFHSGHRTALLLAHPALPVPVRTAVLAAWHQTTDAWRATPGRRGSELPPEVHVPDLPPLPSLAVYRGLLWRVDLTVPEAQALLRTPALSWPDVSWRVRWSPALVAQVARDAATPPRDAALLWRHYLVRARWESPGAWDADAFVEAALAEADPLVSAEIARRLGFEWLMGRCPLPAAQVARLLGHPVRETRLHWVTALSARRTGASSPAPRR